MVDPRKYTGTVIIKLGGSVITDKSKPFSIRFAVLCRIAKELSRAYSRCTEKLIVIHGGGSFGHYVVHEHGNIESNDAVVQTVWYMRELNMKIADILLSYGLPIVPMDTHAMVIKEGNRLRLYIEPIASALRRGLIPLLYGDIAFENDGTVHIVSGDEIAWYLANRLRPSRLYFVTDVEGIYDRDPKLSGSRLLETISISSIEGVLFGSGESIDVTGGIRLKLALAREYLVDGIEEVLIFSGLIENNLYRVLCGDVIRCTRVIR